MTRVKSNNLLQAIQKSHRWDQSPEGQKYHALLKAYKKRLDLLKTKHKKEIQALNDEFFKDYKKVWSIIPKF